MTLGAKCILVWQEGRFVQYFVGYVAASLSSILWMAPVHAHTHIYPSPIYHKQKFLQVSSNIISGQNHTQFKTSILEVLFLKISSLHLSILISTVSLTGRKGTRKARNHYHYHYYYFGKCPNVSEEAMEESKHFIKVQDEVEF